MKKEVKELYVDEQLTNICERLVQLSSSAKKIIMTPKNFKLFYEDLAKLQSDFEIFKRNVSNNYVKKIIEPIGELIKSLRLDAKEKHDELFKVPKEIHYIWLGGPMPARYLDNIHHLVANKKGDGYKVRIWSDNPDKLRAQIINKYGEKFTKNLVIENAETAFTDLSASKLFKDEDEKELWRYFIEECAGHNRNYAAAADILRYIVLFHYGGIYLDTDIETAQDFEEKYIQLYGEVNFGLKLNIQAQRGGSYTINNNVIIAAKGHPVMLGAMKNVLEAYKKHDEKNKKRQHEKFPAIYSYSKRRQGTLEMSGPDALFRAFEKFSGSKFVDFYDTARKKQRCIEQCSKFSFTNGKPRFDNKLPLPLLSTTLGDRCDSTWLSSGLPVILILKEGVELPLELKINGTLIKEAVIVKENQKGQYIAHFYENGEKTHDFDCTEKMQSVLEKKCGLPSRFYLDFDNSYIESDELVSGIVTDTRVLESFGLKVDEKFKPSDTSVFKRSPY